MLNQNYQQFVVPSGLMDKVMARLATEKRLQKEKLQLVILSVFVLILAVIIASVWRSFYNQAQDSGFVQYLSLLYYDYDVVAIYWRDISLSLLESVPVISLIQITVIFGLVFYSLKSIYKYARDLFINYRLITNKQ